MNFEPIIKTKNSAGADLYAKSIEQLDGGVFKIGTGFKLAEPLPEGYYMQLHLRSSLGVKGWSANVGIIDGDYLDEIFVIAKSKTHRVEYVDTYRGRNVPVSTIEPVRPIFEGDRIAQLIVMKHETHKFFNSENETRTGGLGSTGE